MKKFNFFLILGLASALVFTSCKDKAPAEDANATLATTAEAGSDMMNAQPLDPNTGMPMTDTPPVPTGPTTTMTFDKTTHDWGTLKDGEKMTHTFKFTNTGKEPLIISDAKGSCGCTVPEWPKEPIAPGGKGEIKVVFDSKGKGAPEGKADSKKVTVVANTDPVNTYLTIQGNIVGTPAPAPAQ